MQNYEFNLYAKIIFNSDKTQHEAVLKWLKNKNEYLTSSRINKSV
jgi:hypothetical protein